MTNKQNVIKDMIMSVLLGVGIGNIITLIFLSASGMTQISLYKWTVVSIISGLIGLVSSLLFGINDLPAKIAYFLHFILVFILTLVMVSLNDWGDEVSIVQHAFRIFVPFLLVYLGVWFLIYYLNHQKIFEINKRLKERKLQNK